MSDDPAEEVVPGLAEAIEARRKEMGLSPGELVRRTGLTGPGLSPIRKGYRRNYQDRLKFALCDALEWTRDSIDRLLRGEPPVALTRYSYVDDAGVRTPPEGSGDIFDDDIPEPIRLPAGLRRKLSDLTPAEPGSARRVHRRPVQGPSIVNTTELHARNRHRSSLRSEPVGGWNPWRALRGREHIDFRLAPLPHDLGAVYWPRGQRAQIVIDPDLTRVERNVALAHELVHDERSGGCDGSWMPAGWRVVAEREEGIVQQEVARRLVPLEDLEAFVARRMASDIVTTPLDVAEEFDTTEQLAELAMLLLQSESR